MRFSAVAARSLAVSVIAALAIAALAGSGCSERSDVETVAGDTGTALDGYMSAIVPYGFWG